MKHITLHIIIAFFLILSVSAQDYPVKFLDISNGLSNNSVITMHQDDDSYMWFGTYDGLNRYDGYTFKIYRNKINDHSSLLSNTVYCIEGISKTTMWVGGSKGACAYNKGTDAFKPLMYRITKNSPAVILKDEVHQIRAISKNTTLVASQLGLLVFEGSSLTGSPVLLEGASNTQGRYDAAVLEKDENGGGCWVFVKNTGLCRFDYASKKLTLVKPLQIDVKCMEAAPGKSLWLGTDEGLYNLKTGSFTLSDNYLPGKCVVTNVLKDKNNEFWAATDGYGFYRIEGNKGVAYNPSAGAQFVKSNSIWSLYEDRSGNKWIGTLRGGISMIGSTPKYFKNIKYNVKDINPAANFILSFCEDEKHNLWIGTDGAGLRYWNRKTNAYTVYNNTPGTANYISSNFITSIIRDSNNIIWLSTWAGGVNRIDPATNSITQYSCYNTALKRVEKNIWLVYEDSRKNLWASATNEGSLYLFDRAKNAFSLFDSTINNLQCLKETADGKLWGGNYNTLISIDQSRKKHKTYNIGYPVRYIHEDSHKNLWVCTQEGGLLLFDRATGTYKRLTTDNGLPSNTVLRLLEDDAGNLWMSTYNGICRFDPKANTFRNFSISDGLQSNQFSFNAGAELSTGEFLFGGINGFNLFYPDAMKGSGPQAPTLLSGLYVNNQPIEGREGLVAKREAGNIKEIQLPYDQTALSLEFVALDYNNADKINYAYYLEGWDDHWTYAGQVRKANYSRLPAGSYVFKVKTATQGTWNKAVSLAYVTVLPPWYRTWWAYGLYAVMVIGSVIAYIRYSKYKQKLRYEVKIAQMESRKEKEIAEKQLSMFTYISHEFRTPLSLIINPLKKAVQKEGVQSGASGSDLAIAHRNARRLLSLVDQLLLLRKAESDADSLRVSAINVNSLCNEVYQCFVNQAKDKRITYNFYVSDHDIEILGDYEKIEISLFNLMSNAFKYTPVGGSISLALTENDRDIAIEISDTGSGIPASEAEFIFEKFRQVNSRVSVGTGFGIGLYIVKYFVEKHKGTVTCKSEQGMGSVFTLNFLKGYDHFEDYQISDATPKMTALVEELLADNLTDRVEPDDQKPVEELSKKMLTDKRSVLIIDDNAEIRGYLVRLFTEGYVVYSAADGGEGLKLTRQHMPDIILSDITMEGMDGLELCRNIKTNDELSHIPVILLTASKNSETHLQGITDGADDYITKPFDDDILLARVESLLKSRSNLRKYFLDSITLKENTQKVPAEYREFLKKCIDIIEANIDNTDFSIKSFATEMGMSHRTLYTKIKIISGQTLNAFMRSVRLRRAAMLLLTQNINIAQASTQVGFEDPKYFRQQFVKLFGMTPSEYIRKYKSSFNSDLNIVR